MDFCIIGIYSCKTKGVLDKTQTTDYKQNNKKIVLSDFTCKQRAIDKKMLN